jgi:predicted amidophosphoribosyltransferase
LILKFKHNDALHLNPLFAHFLKAPFTTLAEADHLIEPRPATAQSSRRVYRATRPASPHRQAAHAVDDDVMTTVATPYKAAKTPHRAGSGPGRGLVLARILRNGL